MTRLLNFLISFLEQPRNQHGVSVESETEAEGSINEPHTWDDIVIHAADPNFLHNKEKRMGPRYHGKPGFYTLFLTLFIPADL